MQKFVGLRGPYHRIIGCTRLFASLGAFRSQRANFSQLVDHAPYHATACQRVGARLRAGTVPRVGPMLLSFEFTM